MGAAFVALWVALIVLAGVCFVASIFTAQRRENRRARHWRAVI